MGKLYRQLQSYGESNYYPYHMPGHKRHAMGELPSEIAKIDITEIDGFDNLHQAEGILRELQEKAARLYGAEESFYLVNGSTCGILSALSAAVPEGGHILMARNCHKSAYHAAYLRNLTMSYLYPAMYKGYDIYDAITPEQVRRALREEPDIQAVFLVSPTYEGRIADIRSIAEIVHERGIPLIVDEAHGAHLGLAAGFAENSCRQGADIVINSVHKTLPAMTQTALLHVNGERIQRDLLRRFLHIYQSSSPSYVLMASIENALELVEKQGAVLFREFREQYHRLVQNLQRCRRLQFVPLEEGKQDIGKLVISSRNTELSGQQIYDMLLERYHLQLEMAAGSYCLAMFTVGDEQEAYERLEKALFEIDEWTEESRRKAPLAVSSREVMEISDGCLQLEADSEPSGDPIPLEACPESPDNSISLKKAWDMECELIPLREAVGRYVGEFVNLYPPGVPLLVPGEMLRKEQYEQLLTYLTQGLTVQGVNREVPYLLSVLKTEAKTEWEKKG